MHHGLSACEKKSITPTFVVAISQYTRSQLYRWCALEDWRKIHVIHCGLDRRFFAVRQSCPYRNDRVW